MSSKTPRFYLVSYGLSIASFLIALLLSLLLRPVVERVPFMFFWPVVIISAWYGGMGPSLLAVVLSVLTVNHFLLPAYEGNDLYIADAAAIVLFTLLAGFISWLGLVRRRAEEVVYQQREQFSITLNSIGDAVIATDMNSRVTFVNPVAARLTGWTEHEAVDKPIRDIFHIMNEQTRQPVENPVGRVLREGVVVGLANHTVLIAKDGTERPIDDSGAPIRDSEGQLIGAVLVFRDITERRKAEAALQESEASFRTMADTAPVMIWISGTDKLCTFFNRPWLEFTGRTMEQELGNGWAEGVHPDDYERCLNTYVTAFDARREFTMDYRLRRKDGEYRWIVDKGIPLFNSAGEFQGYIGSCIDITERKLAEQKLTEFAAIVNSSDDAIISKSLDGVILSWNPGAERIYGYTAEEMVGQPLAKLVPPDHPDELPQLMERLKRGEHIEHYETVRVTKDGRRLDVSLSISPIRNEKGEVIAAVKVARDVTQRRLADAAMEASERRFRLMADTIPGCVWTATPDGSIDYSNRYWYEFAGLSEEQTAGLGWAMVLHPDDMERTLEEWTNAVNEAIPYQLEARNRRADGQWRWLLNRAVPVRDQDGNITAWFGNSMDVTDLKQAQEAEQQARSDAERRAKRITRLQEITAALSQAVTEQEVASVIVDQGVEALGAASGSVVRLIEQDTMLEIVKAVGYSQAIIEGWRRFPVDTPSAPLGTCVKNKQPVWLGSWEQRLALYPVERERPITKEYEAWAAIPLIVSDRVIGALGLSFATPQEFAEEEQRFVIALADQCAQALERARLYEHEKHVAILEERQRLARDLHDAVSQALFAANVIAQSLPRLHERHPDRVAGRLTELAQLTQGAAAEMRTLLVELRPEMILNNKLGDLLGQFVMAARARKHINISLDIEEDGQPLPQDVHIAIYRIAQETLNNVIKHSRATQATVYLRGNTEEVELRISDNGRGFDAEQVSSGLGLTSMHERALAVGASLQVSSTVGQGTEVNFHWQARDEAGISS